MIVKWVQNGTEIGPTSDKNRSKAVPGVIGCSWGVSWRSLGGPGGSPGIYGQALGRFWHPFGGTKMIKKVIKNNVHF